MVLRLLHGHFLAGLLGLIVVVGLVLLIVYLASRKNKIPTAARAGTVSPSGAIHATHERILAALDELKNSGNMGAAEYEERRLILEGGRADNYANAELVALKERYARAELTTSAYIDARGKLLGAE